MAHGRHRRLSDPDAQYGQKKRRSSGGGVATPLLGMLVVFGIVVALLWARGGSRAIQPALKGAPPSVQRLAQQLSGSVESSAKALLPVEKLVADAAENTAQYPHIAPRSGSVVHAKPVTFTFDGVRHTVAPKVVSSAYWGARAASREALVPAGTSPEQWSAAYYRSIALDPAQTSMIDSACAQLRAIANSDGLDRDQYLELIAKYVQSITYDKTEFVTGKTMVRFPVQTVVDGKGLCEDKSLLLTALLAHEGYATALLSFAPENHMAVGVRGPGATYGDTGYLFLETTQPTYVSEVPPVYDGGMRLRSEPEVVTIGDGTGTYGSAEQVPAILKARDTADAAAQALLASAKRQSLTFAQADKINRQLSLAQQATTDLRSNVVDQKGRPVGHFLDRTQAVRWVRQNAWWL